MLDIAGDAEAQCLVLLGIGGYFRCASKRVTLQLVRGMPNLLPL